MSSVILFSIVSLSVLGALAALILFWAVKKFYVYEDPRIDQVEEALPNANCGACGFPGCRNFAEAIIKSDDISGFYCPVGGNETMKEVAKILGKEAEEQEEKVAVLKCNGSYANSPKVNQYDGPASCAIEHSLYGGETACPYGCLNHGDCVDACDFDAIHINPETGLPEVVDDKCTGCGLCVEACPRDLIKMWPRRKKNRKIYVACMNQDPGAAPKKACSAACIGCELCQKTCRFDAITMEHNLAHINPDKCTLCRECVPVCPTNAILEVGFPPMKKKKAQRKKGKSGATAEKGEGAEKKTDKTKGAAKKSSASGAGSKTGQKNQAQEDKEQKGGSENDLQQGSSSSGSSQSKADSSKQENKYGKQNNQQANSENNQSK